MIDEGLHKYIYIIQHIINELEMNYFIYDFLKHKYHQTIYYNFNKKKKKIF